MARAILPWAAILFVCSSPIVLGYQEHRRALGRPEAPGKVVRFLSIAIVLTVFGIILLAMGDPDWHEGADTRPVVATTCGASAAMSVSYYAVVRLARRRPGSQHTAWLACLLRDLLWFCLGCYVLVVVMHLTLWVVT